ncbi:MAG: hypothetical protein ACI94Z_001186, partial [Yoonia sp.]
QAPALKFWSIPLSYPLHQFHPEKNLLHPFPF